MKILSAGDPFPDPKEAAKTPNGLLCLGGDLNPERLLLAYRQGIFPWFNTGEPIAWWSPDPRAVLYFKDFHLSRRFKQYLKQAPFIVTINQAFETVIRRCAAPRQRENQTWITAEMIEAYCELHQLGHALSVECWHNDQLAGGIYGVQIDKVFFAESMFSAKTNASKAALSYLIEYLSTQELSWLDCQIMNPHLARLGAVNISRETYLLLLKSGIL